jgi:hypothetical protein
MTTDFKWVQNVQMVIVVLINSVGAVQLIHATIIGPSVGSDSVDYVEAARNFSAGGRLVLVQASTAGRVVYDEGQLRNSVYDYPQDTDLDCQAWREFVE